MLGWTIVTRFSKWIVGNEKLIRFWLDPWASTINTPITNLIQGPSNKNDHLLTLYSFIQNKHWNLSQLSFHLPNNLQKIITNTIIPTTPNTTTLTDSIFWTMSSNGNFTTPSCYNSLNSTMDNSDINLNWLWQIQAQKSHSFSLDLLA